MKAKITIRNILLLVISVLLLCSVMGIGASASELHNNLNFTCSHNLPENGWGDYADFDCIEIQYCQDCYNNGGYQYAGRYKTDASLHRAGLWEVVTPNTCEREGLEAVFCLDCGYKLMERAIPAHDYKVLYGDEATCMKKGYQFIACLKCFDMKTVELEIDPEAHNFSDWEITRVATCVNESGVRTKRCLCVDENGNGCNEVITEAYKDPTNHVETDWEEYEERKDPTCYECGYLYKTCSGCGEYISKELPIHSQSTFTVLSVVPSTCHTNGVERRECDECGYEYDVVLEFDKTNHEFGDWKVIKEPSCTVGEIKRACRYCAGATETKTVLANGEHNYGEWVTTIEPDCSKTGVEKQTCADCGKVVTRELPTKHDYTTWTTVQNFSCDESNLSDGIRHAECSSCTFTKYFTIPAIHDFGPWVIEKASTCKNGNTGVRKRTCANCQKVERENYVAEHKFGDWYVTTEPVCAADGKSGFEGVRTRWCKTCTYYEHEPIGVNHEFTEWEIKYPTCTDSGEKVAKCNFCDAAKKEYIESPGHIYGDVQYEKWNADTNAWVAVEDISKLACSETYREVKMCLSCKDVYTSESKAVGHDYGNWYIADGFTCSAASEKMKRDCKKCGAAIESENPMSLNHPNLKVITTEATCSTSGYVQEICPDCGYTKLLTETIVPAKGHNLEDKWTERFKATCTTSGARYKACLDCDYIEYQEIEKYQHNLIALEEEIKATCTTDGKRPQSYCSNCLEVFPSTVVPALGHDFSKSETCSRCGVYDGSNDCVCACHSQSGIEKIFFNLINKFYQLFGINQYCGCGELHYEEVGFIGKLFGR